MMPAVSNPQDILLSYGLPGVVILALAGVVIYIYRELQKQRQKIDDLQEQRLQDIKDFTTSLKGPVEAQIELTQRLYDLVYDESRRKR